MVIIKRITFLICLLSMMLLYCGTFCLAADQADQTDQTGQESSSKEETTGFLLVNYL